MPLATLTSKGQITIPGSLRKKLNPGCLSAADNKALLACSFG